MDEKSFSPKARYLKDMNFDDELALSKLFIEHTEILVLTVPPALSPNLSYSRKSDLLS